MNMDFTRMLDAAYRVFGVPAVYRAGGAGPGVEVIVLRHSPTETETMFNAALAADTTILKVRGSEVVQPMAGDTLTIGSETFAVQGAPAASALRTEWTLDTKPT